MTQEDKELLLKDICSRLPYGIKASYYGAEEACETWDEIEGVTLDGFVDIGQYSLPIERIKLYLFPLSSMTDEEEKEYNILRDDVQTYHYEFGDIVDDVELCDNWESIDYLNAHHFDFRGLIEKSLALDATNLDIYEFKNNKKRL